MTAINLMKDIQPWLLAVASVTKDFVRHILISLTLEVFTFNFALGHNVHWNTIEFGLKRLDLICQVIDGLHGSLCRKILRGLDDQKVDFLGFAISFGPAELHWWLAFIVKSKRSVSLANHWFDFLSVLSSSECNLVFVDSSDWVGDGHSNVKGLRRNWDTDGLSLVKQEL